MRNLVDLLPFQFRVLYRVFLLRVIDLELLSADSDTTKLVGQFAGLFATFSLIISFPFILFGFPRASAPGSWIFEHFLIATTMLVVGLFSVLTWDSIFPDQRDVLVLAPLPVRPGTLFQAKLAALLATVGIVVSSLSIASGFTFPLMLFPQNSGLLGILRCIVAYWITVSAAGAFTFCCIVAIQALAAQLLPRQFFLRFSAILQAMLFCLMVATYFLEPSLESPRALSAPENQHLLAALPAYWFLGLFQQINGSMTPAMLPLAKRAWTALVLALLGSGSLVFLSYFRVMRKLVEQPDILPSRRRLMRPSIFGGSLHASVALFSIRALSRSRQHRVLLSFYFSVGSAVVFAYVRKPLEQRLFTGPSKADRIDPAFLAASILMLCLAFFGLRIVSIIPIFLRANWIFRVSQVRTPREYLNAVRFSWLLLGVAPIWLASAALLLSTYSWPQVGKHLLLLALLGLLLVEISLQTFRKIPFTWSYLPAKGNLNLLFWVSLALFPFLLGKVARYEGHFMLHLPSFAATVLSLVSLLAVAHYRIRLLFTSDEGLIFEEEESAILVSLKLS